MVEYKRLGTAGGGRGRGPRGALGTALGKAKRLEALPRVARSVKAKQLEAYALVNLFKFML